MDHMANYGVFAQAATTKQRVCYVAFIDSLDLSLKGVKKGSGQLSGVRKRHKQYEALSALLGLLRSILQRISNITNHTFTLNKYAI